MVSELGSGSGRKTRWILSALGGREPVSYYPIEISRAALASCAVRAERHRERQHRGGRARVPGRPARSRRAARRRAHLLVLFLGSTIGNFDSGADARFLSDVRDILAPGDLLLLGADLLKPLDRMVAGLR